MFGRVGLLDEFNRLKSSSDAHQRGRDLERLLVQVFRSAHFKVEHNPGITNPRQTDLTASYGPDRYLIEAKWEREALGSRHIDDMRLARLGRTEGTVVGVIFSANGFRDSAIKEVAARRERSVLLFGHLELQRILAYPDELLRLLQLKREELIVHGRVHLETATSPKRKSPRESHHLPAAEISPRNVHGEPLSYVTSRGHFGPFVFAQKLTDVDCGFGGGFGVTLDLPVEIYDGEGMVDLLSEMHRMGWIGDQPRWNIQQASTNWHGIGARSFVETLRDWQARIDVVERPHHTEEATYYDTCVGGLFTLAADVACHESRAVRRCNLSFQLEGVPLDINPVKHLYETFNVTAVPHFRPLSAPAVQTYRPPRDNQIAVEAVGFLTQHETLGPGEDWNWVTGIVAKNPYQNASDAPAPAEWPAHLKETDLVICDLRSHHPLGETPRNYHMYAWETLRTSDALIVRPLADW